MIYLLNDRVPTETLRGWLDTVLPEGLGFLAIDARRKRAVFVTKLRELMPDTKCSLYVTDYECALRTEQGRYGLYAVRRGITGNEVHNILTLTRIGRLKPTRRYAVCRSMRDDMADLIERIVNESRNKSDNQGAENIPSDPEGGDGGTHRADPEGNEVHG